LDRAYRARPGRTRSKTLSLKAGDKVGLRLDGIQRDQVLHGDVLAR
jgi:translation elongation factor EF-Tu-like GTPase